MAFMILILFAMIGYVVGFILTDEPGMLFGTLALMSFLAALSYYIQAVG